MLPKARFEGFRNKVRQRVCSSIARPLLPGETHAPCANFTGPGTKLDEFVPGTRIKVRDWPAYPGGIDECSKTHDLDYNRIFRIVDPKERARQVRRADKDAIDCYNQHKSDPMYPFAFAGIKGKILAENVAPPIAKKVAGVYYGSETGGLVSNKLTSRIGPAARRDLMPLTSSRVQSVDFSMRDGWSVKMARAWLRKHKLVPIKEPDLSVRGHLRMRIADPDDFDRFIVKKVSRGIGLVIGFP